MKPMNRTIRYTLLTSVAVLVLLMLLFRPAPLPVDIARSEYGPLAVMLEEEGVTRVIDRFTLSAPVTGMVLRSPLAEGDSIRAGMTVALIVPPGQNAREYREVSSLAGSATASVSEAVARQRQAAVRLEQARLKSARYETLFNGGAISRESRDLAAEDVAVLEKELEAASSALRAVRLQAAAAEARIDRGSAGSAKALCSPVEGRVLRLYEKNEKVVSAGTPLLEIGNPHLLEVVIDVLSSDAVKVKPGDPVIIEEWGGDGVLGGVVKRIEPAAFTRVSALGIEEKRVNVVAMLDRPEPRLGDNYRIEAKIVIWYSARVLRVPVSALFRRSGVWSLFVIDGDRATIRNVRVGMRGADQVEVLSGLRPGERVILHPQNELKEGTRVEVSEQY
jgi:HlyD family secretion protein